ncbi:hypothetical protein FPOAC1_011003 [Fusarium poae]|uniref:hypothetical protein n=1 Tax=Fusarium poae TaxID=36050 RepID=UPI001CE7B546|nr:hypothetical protein FPOAC1_011003 [Fusarium poae]KAG8666200.1 hypothetical protein FPOAC1_011003 [Fusarium poae]
MPNIKVALEKRKRVSKACNTCKTRKQKLTAPYHHIPYTIVAVCHISSVQDEIGNCSCQRETSSGINNVNLSRSEQSFSGLRWPDKLQELPQARATMRVSAEHDLGEQSPEAAEHSDTPGTSGKTASQYALRRSASPGKLDGFRILSTLRSEEIGQYTPPRTEYCQQRYQNLITLHFPLLKPPDFAECYATESFVALVKQHLNLGSGSSNFTESSCISSGPQQTSPASPYPTWPPKLSHITTARRHDAHSYCVRAFEVAHSFGIHQGKKTEIESWSDTQKISRRNVWRSLFVLDRFLAATLGKPLAINQYTDESLVLPKGTLLNPAVDACRIIGETVKVVYLGPMISMKAVKVLLGYLDSLTDVKVAPLALSVAQVRVDSFRIYADILLCRPFFLLRFIASAQERETLNNIEPQINELSQRCVSKRATTVKPELERYAYQTKTEIINAYESSQYRSPFHQRTQSSWVPSYDSRRRPAADDHNAVKQESHDHLNASASIHQTLVENYQRSSHNEDSGDMDLDGSQCGRFE